MANLITAQEFAQYRNISKKLDLDKINEAISLSQQSDLLNLLGDFYFDVIQNSSDQDWVDLMDGGEFEYNGKRYEHEGIKKLLGDYTYARFSMMGNINVTPFGFQKKYTNDSEGIDRAQIKDISKQAQVDAGLKFKYIEKYILSRPDLFSRYCTEGKDAVKYNSQRFSKL